MKSIGRSTFFIILLVLFSHYLFSQGSKLSYYDSLKTMPPFKYYLTNGTAYTPNNVSGKRTTMMIYFKNDCPYCQKEATIISNNIKELANIDFVFITRQDTSLIKTFAKENKLENISNVKFVEDKDKLYYTFCKALYTPSIHVYNKHKKLIEFTEGVMKKDEILKYNE